MFPYRPYRLEEFKPGVCMTLLVTEETVESARKLLEIGTITVKENPMTVTPFPH